jgi:hypothetical protein
MGLNLHENDYERGSKEAIATCTSETIKMTFAWLNFHENDYERVSL